MVINEKCFAGDIIASGCLPLIQKLDSFEFLHIAHAHLTNAEALPILRSKYDYEKKRGREDKSSSICMETRYVLIFPRNKQIKSNYELELRISRIKDFRMDQTFFYTSFNCFLKRFSTKLNKKEKILFGRKFKLYHPTHNMCALEVEYE